MREAGQLDNILNECLDRVIARGETVEQCLRDYPAQAETLRPLLLAVLNTRKAAAELKPDPDFRLRARYQMLAALDALEQKKARRGLVWGFRPQWVAALAVVLALLLGGGGTVAAASGSMPDEPLYAVKLATENVQVALTRSAVGKAELYSRMADRRVEEIGRMTEEDDPEGIEKATGLLRAHLAHIAALQIGPGEKPTQEPAPSEVNTPEKSMPPGQAKKENGESPSAQREHDEVKDTIKGRAAENPAKLRALLNSAPEKVKPALKRAIAESESGYDEAINSLGGPDERD